MTAGSAVEVLIVEDSEEDAELALRVLRKHKVANAILVLRDGQEALDYLFSPRTEKHRLRVILLDLKLPRVDGLEVLKRVKEDEQTRSIPVVMMTSSGEERDLVQSYALGANSYVVKPVDFDAFVKAITDLGLYWLLINRMPPS